jgi:hypothetical protein
MNNLFIAYRESHSGYSCGRCHRRDCHHSTSEQDSHFEIHDELNDEDLVKVWAKAIKCGVDQVHIYRNGTKVFGEFGIIDVINTYSLELSDEEYELRIRYQRDIAEIESKALELSKAK